MLGLSPAQFTPVYQELEDKGYVEDYLAGLAYQWEDLIDDAQEIMQELGIEAKRRRRGGRKPQQLRESFEITLSDYTSDRAAALSEALADEAASYAAIGRFREEVLDGELLSSEQARDFVTSPAVRFFWFEWFKEWGIPVVGHAAQVVNTHFRVPAFEWGTLPGIWSGFDPDIHRFYTVYVEPPGAEKSVLYAHQEDVEIPEVLTVDKQYFFTTDPEDEFDRPSPEKKLRYFARGGIREARMLPGSLLDWLRHLADLLTGRYGWSQEEAVAFVLTGQKPQIQPLKVSANLLTGYRNSPPVWNVSLKVAPWVPAKEVAGAYQEIQQQILRGDSGKEHLSLKKIALFRFVKEQTRGIEEEPDWQELLDRWNRLHKADDTWHYGVTKEPRHRKANFKRDFEDAERVLLHSQHHFPQRKVNTVLEEWQEQEVPGRRAAAKAEVSRIEAYLNQEEGVMDN